MLGAIIGDIVGSVYEWDNIKTKDFPILNSKAFFTDDTVMTCAIAKGLMSSDINDENDIKKNVIKSMIELGIIYPNVSYGSHFRFWLYGTSHKPYNSFGNGSAMRVASVAWMAKDLKEAQNLAKLTAEVTHNHSEGIKGAQAVASAIFLARTKHTKNEIKSYLSKFYNLDFSLEEIRPFYQFDVTCQGSVPQAIVAFLESHDFEDSIRNAISIGGDSDTIATITGSISEAYYGIPLELKNHALRKLDLFLSQIVSSFRGQYQNEQIL